MVAFSFQYLNKILLELLANPRSDVYILKSRITLLPIAISRIILFWDIAAKPSWNCLVSPWLVLVIIDSFYKKIKANSSPLPATCVIPTLRRRKRRIYVIINMTFEYAFVCDANQKRISSKMNKSVCVSATASDLRLRWHIPNTKVCCGDAYRMTYDSKW